MREMASRRPSSRHGRASGLMPVPPRACKISCQFRIIYQLRRHYHYQQLKQHAANISSTTCTTYQQDWLSSATTHRLSCEAVESSTTPVMDAKLNVSSMVAWVRPSSQPLSLPPSFIFLGAAIRNSATRIRDPCLVAPREICQLVLLRTHVLHYKLCSTTSTTLTLLCTWQLTAAAAMLVREWE